MTGIGFSTKASKHGRVGILELSNNHLSTPLLFPVVSLITGTTPRGGGLWKYILQAHSCGLMRRNKPLLTQVLHFLDFTAHEIRNEVMEQGLGGEKWSRNWRRTPR